MGRLLVSNVMSGWSRFRNTRGLPHQFASKSPNYIRKAKIALHVESSNCRLDLCDMTVLGAVAVAGARVEANQNQAIYSC